MYNINYKYESSDVLMNCEAEDGVIWGTHVVIDGGPDGGQFAATSPQYDAHFTAASWQQNQHIKRQ